MNEQPSAGTSPTAPGAIAKLSSEQIAALADAQCAAIGLTLSLSHRPGTLQNLALIATMAQSVMSFPLSPDIEPAAVFSHDKS